MTLSKKAKLAGAKAIISIAAGWLAVLLCRQAVPIDSAHDLYFVWSLVFPLSVSWCWGGIYALVSAFGGGVFLIPFLLTEHYGYGNLIYSALYILLLLLAGFLCGEKGKKTNLYLVMLLYSFVSYAAVSILVNTITQAGGSSMQYFPGTVLPVQPLNNLLSLFVLVLAVKILFMLPIVRKLFGLPALPNGEENLTPVLFAVLLCLLFLVFPAIEAVYTHHETPAYAYDKTVLQALIFFMVVLVALDYVLYNAMKALDYRKRLISREEHYRTIFYNMIDTYIEINRKGVVIFCSPAVTHTLGYTDAYVCGKPLRNFFEDPQAVDAFIDDLFKTQSNDNAEFASVYYNKRRQLLLKGAVKNPSEADVTGVITLRDITDYKNAEEKRRELLAVTNAIFESNKDLIWVVNGRDFTIMFCNKAFKDYVLRTRGIVVAAGCKASTLFTEHEAVLLAEYYHRVLEKGNFFVEFTTDEEELILDLSLYPVTISEENVNISIFAKDMTHQREIENQILVLNKGLEEMVAKRTSELYEAYGDLESYSYTITHEFKTPIREIDAYMSIIEEDNEGRLLPGSTDDIRAVRRICAETLEMTQKMMMYSKAGYMVFDIEKIDMERLVRECFDELNIAQDLPAELHCNHLLPLDADAFMMRVAVSNILSNSFKFSRRKGRVDITVNCEKHGDEIAYSFRDRGDGFSVQDSNELFGLYNRAHTKEFEGSGIGLAVVKKICLRSGGDAEIFGEKGVGCTVIMRFTRHDTP